MDRILHIPILPEFCSSKQIPKWHNNAYGSTQWQLVCNTFVGSLEHRAMRPAVASPGSGPGGLLSRWLSSAAPVGSARTSWIPPVAATLPFGCSRTNAPDKRQPTPNGEVGTPVTAPCCESLTDERVGHHSKPPRWKRLSGQGISKGGVQQAGWKKPLAEKKLLEGIIL